MPNCALAMRTRARQRTTQGDGLDHFLFGYDGLSRLLSAQATLSPGTTRSESFDYDPATNISTRTGPDASYTMDGANRVTGDGTQSFTWDGADRLVQRGADTFAYDALSRLVSSTVSGVARTYAYDGDGLLRSRSEASGTTPYLWDTSIAPAPLLAAGTDRVVHGLGPLYVARADGSTLRLVRDALGSVRVELDDAGLPAKSFPYAAYGVGLDRLPTDATPSLLGFTGELADPSGLTYLRARWYDPTLGRLMTRDEFPGSSEVPVSLNAFGYAHANPGLLTDPTGHCPPCIVAAVVVGLKVGLFVSDVMGTVETLSDPTASKGEKAAVTGLLILGTLTGSGQATVARGAIQAAKAVARAGRSRGVLVMPGGIRAAEQLFSEAARGARITPHPRAPGGQLAELSDGGHLGLRPTSTSGEATLDVNIPGIDIRKIKFLPE